MDDERERDEIDERIRAALTADAAARNRIVERALAADDAGTRSLMNRALLAAAVVAIVATGWWQMRASPSLELAISGKQSWVVVNGSDGRRWIVGPRSDRGQRGSYVIVVPQ
jgi:hypothetical protein